MSAPPVVTFFGTYDAGAAGIPKLSVGTDRSLDDGLTAIVRLQGRDEADEVTFDHLLVALGTRGLDLVADALSERLDVTTNSVTRIDVEHTLRVVRRALAIATFHERLLRLVRDLAEGEKLMLADEGATTIVCVCEHPATYNVNRWAEPVIHRTLGIRTTVDVALCDRDVAGNMGVVD